MAGTDGGGAAVSEYLIVFAHHNMYFNMRFQELEALAALLDLAPSREALYVGEPPTALAPSILVTVRLKGGDAAVRRLCERAVLIKAVLEVWAQGSDYREAVAAALQDTETLRARQRPFLAPPRTFHIRVVSFGRTLTMEEKSETIEGIRPLFVGDEIADLREPDTTVWALEEHEHHTEEKTHLGPRTCKAKRTFIGRQVAGGRSLDKKLKGGEKSYFLRYELSERAVLGPTTLENELAFIMANCACVQEGQIALEPFCGTGGIMIALSHFGARLFGGEIDIRVVKGWRIAYTKNKAAALEVARSRGLLPEEAAGGDDSREAASDSPCPASSSSAAPAPESASLPPGPCRDIFTNFMQYKHHLPEVVVLDNAVSPWRQVPGGWCDCIVTDPPYGVRAGAKKQGRNPESRHVEIADPSTYIPSKVNYDEEDLSRDLMTLASTALHDGGRLVFLVPVDLADFLGIDRAAVERGGGPRGSLHETTMPKGGRKKDPRLCISETTRDPLLLDEARYKDFLPSHKDLELLGASLQVLSGGLGRLLVTMRRRPRARTE